MSDWVIHPAATLFPLLEGAEFEALTADIRANDLREAIWLDRDGRILDGRNRIRACEAAGVEPRFQTYEGDDPVAFVLSLNLLRRHLDESQKAMAAARVANMNHGGDRRSDQAANLPLVPQAEAAQRLGVSERSLRYAKVVQESGSPELVAAVDQGVVAVSEAAAVARASHTTQRAIVAMVASGEVGNLKTALVRRDKERQRLEIAEGRTVQPEGEFPVIVIDPPWPYDNTYDAAHPTGRAGCKYPSMSIEELKALKLPAAKNCVLWLWTTNAFMGEAYDLLEAWGFQPKTILTWVKLTKLSEQPRLGLGHWLKNCTEHCLLAVKGSPKVSLTNQRTVLVAPARGHSRKPNEFYELVESLCIGRKLDMFSTEKRDGWEQMGNDTAKFRAAE